MHDWDLIKAYREAARSNSEADQKRAETAFSELVHRHLNLVFSAALRSLGGNHSLARKMSRKKRSHYSPPRRTNSHLHYPSLAGSIGQPATSRAMHSARKTAVALVNWRPCKCTRKQPNFLLTQPGKTSPHSSSRPWSHCPRTTASLSFSASSSANRSGKSPQNFKLRRKPLACAPHAPCKSSAPFFSQSGVTISAIAIGNALLESAVSAAPAVLAASLAAPLKLTAVSIPLSLTTKWILMTTLQKSATVTVALLLAIGIGAGATLQKAQKSQSSNIASAAKTANSTPATQSVTPTSTSNTTATVIANTRLDRAIANLRLALTSEWPDRRVPMARLRDAVSDFGLDCKAAVPIILEYLNGLRASRSLTAVSGAAYCLELLGTDASSALPDLLILLRSGDLAVWNDFIPRVFTALSPDGTVIPEFIDLVARIPKFGGEQLIYTLEKLFEVNPSAIPIHLPRLQVLLKDRNARFAAAVLLARIPGPKDPAAISILTTALSAPRMQMGIGHDYITEEGLHAHSSLHEMGQDDLSRFAAVQALGEMGPAASNALPALLAFLENAPTNSPYNLRDLALVAIGKIDPTRRDESPDVALALFQHERSAEILQKAKSGTASFTELTEGLRLRNAANTAALALGNHPEARAAIPALVEAVNNFGSEEAVDRLKELDPHILIDRVRAGDDRAIAEVARALGELGPDAAPALPHLIAMLDSTSPSHPETHRVHALNKAIHQIDPSQPKLLYNFEDLGMASTVLMSAIDDQKKTGSPVHNAYIRDFRDPIAFSRGHLLRFVEATKADPALHNIFTNQLLRDHPDLAADLAQLAPRQ